MTSSDAILISAADFLDPQGSIVASARLLGTHLQKVTVSNGQVIEVSFVGVKGLSSSYFNMLLRLVLPEIGADTFVQRIHCRFDSALQESVFKRSWEAVSKEAA